MLGPACLLEVTSPDCSSPAPRVRAVSQYCISLLIWVADCQKARRENCCSETSSAKLLTTQLPGPRVKSTPVPGSSLAALQSCCLKAPTVSQVIHITGEATFTFPRAVPGPKVGLHAAQKHHTYVPRQNVFWKSQFLPSLVSDSESASMAINWKVNPSRSIPLTPHSTSTNISLLIFPTCVLGR